MSSLDVPRLAAPHTSTLPKSRCASRFAAEGTDFPSPLRLMDRYSAPAVAVLCKRQRSVSPLPAEAPAEIRGDNCEENSRPCKRFPGRHQSIVRSRPSPRILQKGILLFKAYFSVAEQVLQDFQLQTSTSWRFF